MVLNGRVKSAITLFIAVGDEDGSGDYYTGRKRSVRPIRLKSASMEVATLLVHQAHRYAFGF